MKYIILSNNQRVKISDDQFLELSQYNWRLNKKGYVVRNSNRYEGKRRIIFMHRMILPVFNKLLVDHIDGNKLNCQKENLRLVNFQESSYNRPKPRTWRCNLVASKYKGISWNKKLKKWMVAISSNHQRFYLGCVVSEVKAAKLYDEKAKELFGKFARLNFI